jgi:hypothetical protein
MMGARFVKLNARIALLSLFTSLFAAAEASAMTYVAADFRTLVLEARAIAIGRVVSLDPQWTEGRRNIETVLTLEVEEYLKGSLGRTVEVTVPGGQMGPYRSVMPGAPQFVEGEELVLFLAGEAPAVPHVLGLGQGVFRILTNQSTGVRLVVPEISRVMSADATAVVRGDLVRRPSSLPQFAADVRAIMAGRGAR